MTVKQNVGNMQSCIHCYRDERKRLVAYHGQRVALYRQLMVSQLYSDRRLNHSLWRTLLSSVLNWVLYNTVGEIKLRQVIWLIGQLTQTKMLRHLSSHNDLAKV